MYAFNRDGRLQRLRTQEAFREDAWAQTPSGIILPVSQPDVKAEEAPEVQWQQHPSGLVLPVAAPPKKPPKPTCISLFTGAGGFDLGFHNAGWRIVAASDYETSCAWTYCYNMGTRPIQMHFLSPQDRERFVTQVVKRSQRKPKANKGEHWDLVELDEQDRAYFHRLSQRPVAVEEGTPHYFLGDVRKLTGEMILLALGMQKGEPGCVTGGPPCQGFSVAGRREVMDPRNSLVFEFARLILELAPQTFVFENVPGIASMVTPEGIPVLDAFAHMLSEGGYASYEGLKKGLDHNLNAWGAVKGQGGSKERLKKNGKEAQGGEEDEPEGDGLEQMSLF
jgi:DNA (cytosine-5)-methyltransferase 1